MIVPINNKENWANAGASKQTRISKETASKRTKQQQQQQQQRTNEKPTQRRCETGKNI